MTQQQFSMRDVQAALRTINMTESGRIFLGWLGARYGFMTSPINNRDVSDREVFYRVGQRDLVTDLHRLIEFDLPDGENLVQQEKTGNAHEDNETPLF